MDTRPIMKVFQLLTGLPKQAVLLLAVLVLKNQAVQAGELIKQDNTGNLSLTSSWSGGFVPGAADVALWTNTITGANSTLLGADLSWSGIRIANPGGAVAVGGGNTLTLGSQGIDMGTATADLTLACGLILKGQQSWKVADGRTLDVTGPFTRTGAVVDFTGFSGTATLGTLSNDVSGILGPWATAGDGAALNYVKSASGVLSAATQTAGIANLANVINAKENYFFSTGGYLSTSITANTLRFVGSSALLTSPSGKTVTLNGLMNAGTGNLTISGSGNLMIGANRELVVAASQNITLPNVRIVDNIAGPSSLTYSGYNGSMLTLSVSTSTYKGGTTVNAGILNIVAGIPVGSGPVTVNAGATLLLGTTALTNSLILDGGTLLDSAGKVNTWKGPITLAATSVITCLGTMGWTNTGSGAGGLIKDGTGTFTLFGTNTYSGGTTVSAGILAVSGSGTLGSGNVTVNAGTLSLSANDAIADTATLAVTNGATIALAAGVNERVGALYLDGSSMPVGTYGSSSSSASNRDDTYFSGMGVLSVGEPVLLPMGSLILIGPDINTSGWPLPFITNTVPFEDGFEDYPAGTPVSGISGWMTAGGASSIQNLSYTYAGFPPLDITHTNALQLEAEEQMLCTLFETNASVGASHTWVDMLARLNPSEATPNIGDTALAGIFADSNSNLVFYAATLDPDGHLIPAFFSFTNLVAAEWHRLTFEIAPAADNTNDFVQVFLDGAVLTNAAARVNPASSEAGGTWFCLTRHEDNPVTALGFQGTGWIDDLTVTTAGVFENQPPSVEITSPTSSATVNTTFTITANASDSDGSIANVTFYDGATLIYTDTSSPYSYDWCSAPAGGHALTAVARDNSGLCTTSATVNITVVPPTLEVSGFPSSQKVGTLGDVTVTAKDILGNTFTAYTGTVHFTSSDGAAVLPSDYAFMPGDNGTHTFTSGVTLNTVGTQSITATDTVTGAIAGTQSGITVWSPPTVFSWTNSVSGSWSIAGNWTNDMGSVATLDALGLPDYTLNFDQAGTYSAYNDLEGVFSLNWLNFGGAAVTLAGNSLAFSGTLPQATQNSAAAVTVGNNLVLGTNTTFGGTGTGMVTVNGAISGGGGLTKSGPCTLMLSNTNSYAGATIINEGTVVFTKPSALYSNVVARWTPENIIVSSGAVLQVSIGGSAFQPSQVASLISQLLTVNNNGLKAGSTVSIDALYLGTTLSANITDSTGPGGGKVGLQLAGTRILTLVGSNTYTGPTRLIGSSGSIVKVGKSSVPGVSGALGNNSAVSFLAGTSTLDITAFDLYIGSLSGSANGSKLILGSKTLTVGGDNTSPAAFAGVISGNGGNLIKVGTGKLMLSGNNTYTGATTIVSGTLILGTSGSISNTMQLAIGAGATFDVSLKTSPYGFGVGTSLNASGTGTEPGTAATLAGASGGIIDLVSRPVTLNLAAGIVPGDTTHPALFISQGTLALGGNPFTVNAAAPLAQGTYVIIQQASGVITDGGGYPAVVGTAVSGTEGHISVSGGSVILTVIGTNPTVTFDAQEGTVPSPVSKVVTNDLAYGELATTTRTGYTFAGWRTEPAGAGSLVTSDTTVTNPSDHTLYAAWTANEYTVTFDAQGGTVSPTNIVVVFGSNYGFLPLPDRTGHTFDGWWTASGGTGAQVSGATTVSVPSDHTLFAKWIPLVYAVAFDLGAHGTRTGGGELEQNVAYGGAAAAPAVQADPGWTFEGWDGAFGNVTGPLTVHAQYGQIFHALSVESAHGVPSPVSGNHSYAWGTDIESFVSGMESQGTTQYVCTGWAGTGSVPQYGATTNVSFAITNDSSIAWQWATNYWLDVAAEGNGIVTNGSGWCSAGSVTQVLALASSGYHFEGWSGDVEGLNTNDNPLSVLMDRSLSLTANFAINRYVITATAGPNGSIDPSGAVLVAHGASQSFTNSPDAHHHVSELLVNGVPVAVADNYTFQNVTNSHTISVSFAIDTYTVMFDAQGGLVSPTNKIVAFDSVYGVLPVPERIGHTFGGWWTGAGGAGERVTEGATVSITMDQTLYALWTASVYSVTFDAQGGTVSPASKSVTYGSAYDAVPMPSRAGYEFAGWWTASGGTGTQVSGATTVSVPSDHTLFAAWTAGNYMVAFDPEGGTVNPAAKAVVYAAAYGELPMPAYAGHVFGGWWTGADGTGSQVTNTTPVTEPSSHMLYARWDFAYALNGAAYTIAGYYGTNGMAVIPDTLAGLPVTSLGDRAFYNCASLTNVMISGNVTNIGDSTFYGCSKLNGIDIPAGLKGIGANAFYGCSKITRAAIPAGVGVIGAKTFYNCSSLTNVTISVGVTVIGDNAFSGCSKLLGVAIPSGVTAIGVGAFAECASLLAITVDELNTSYSSLDGVLLDEGLNTLIQCPGGKTGSYTVPGSVTRILDAAFRSCARLTAITIPGSVTNMGERTFAECLGLTGVTIHNGVPGIGAMAFYHCTGLTSVTIPGSVTNVGSSAFFNCTGLIGVTIPVGVVGVGESAFFGCQKLAGVTIPVSVTSIGVRAFANCSALTAINVDGGNLSYCSVDGVLYDRGMGTLVQCPSGKTGSYRIPGSVTRITSSGFYKCAGLTSVTVEGNVDTIGDEAFYNCTGLTGVFFAGNASSMGEDVFTNAYNVSIYYMPGTFGWGATFAGCPPVVLWNPSIPANDALFGFLNNRFGFTVTGTANIPVVVEACTNMAGGGWVPLQTITLNNGSFYFSDPNWGTYPARFYRLRTP